MDLKVKRIKWMGNIYQKFEAVCQEVDDIVGQDAVKYLENRVQNVGDSVKRFCSDVVQDLLPLPPVVSSPKYEAHSAAVAGVKEDDNNDDDDDDDDSDDDEKNPVNNFVVSLQDSNAIDLPNDQKALASIEHDCVNQVSDETYADSLAVEDSYVSQEEVGDDLSRETSGDEKENLHSSIEKIAVQSAPQLMNLIPFKEKEPLEFSIGSESGSGSDSGCRVSVRAKDNLDVSVEHDSCLIVEKNYLNSSTSQMLSSMSLGEKESCEASLFSQRSDVFDEDTRGILAEVLPAASALSCERLMTKMEPLCSKSSLISNSQSLGSYSFEIESCKNNLDDLSWYVSDSCRVHLCCEPTPPVAGQIMESQDGLVSSGCSQPMASNDESLVNSVESSMEDIQLNDDANLEESCVFVDDSELYAVSCRAQKLRSYKKRIRDAFVPKKRLAKEYEQLAIWYGDTEMEPIQGLSRTVLPFSSRTYVDPKNLQVQQASETEWELL